MTHWQVFETKLPGYPGRFLRCAVWANAPQDALRTLHNHDRCWHDGARHIAIWEDNHKHDPIDGLVHWVVDARGHPISGAAPPASGPNPAASPPAGPTASTDLAVLENGAVPAAVVASANSLPMPGPAPTTAPVADPSQSPDGRGHEHRVARETSNATDLHQLAALTAELDALKQYIRGQTLADLAFQEHALLEHARRSGDVQLIKSAEASAASSFGPDWRTRIPALLDNGRALDAAALQS